MIPGVPLSKLPIAKKMQQISDSMGIPQEEIQAVYNKTKHQFGKILKHLWDYEIHTEKQIAQFSSKLYLLDETTLVQLTDTDTLIFDFASKKLCSTVKNTLCKIWSNKNIFRLAETQYEYYAKHSGACIGVMPHTLVPNTHCTSVFAFESGFGIHCGINRLEMWDLKTLQPLVLLGNDTKCKYYYGSFFLPVRGVLKMVFIMDCGMQV